MFARKWEKKAINKKSITFFGGVNEIGGNKFLLQDKDTKVFLDFDLSFSKQARYFDGYARDPVRFTELIDIKPSIGGDFIHSMSEPFSEEDIETKVLHNWLNHFGLKFHQIHASGHCPSRDLVKVINKIQPKKLVPIHTEHPTIFKELFRKYPVKLVNEGQEILL